VGRRRRPRATCQGVHRARHQVGPRIAGAGSAPGRERGGRPARSWLLSACGAPATFRKTPRRRRPKVR
jgi:hypothetical protein